MSKESIKNKIKNLLEDTSSDNSHEPDSLVVKNRLKVLRAERDWTQADLAMRVGISRQAVISIEKYKYTPSLELAFRIARVFEVEFSEVFRAEVVTEMERDE